MAEATASHHAEVVSNYEGAAGRWRTAERRCQRCWLRDYDCYCSTLAEQAAECAALPAPANPRIEVIMYYYFLELGRSGNTGHLLESLLPTVTTPLVFGDSEAEQALVNRIVSEYRSGSVDTVILYPSSDAVLLSDYLSARAAKAGATAATAAAAANTVRLVALDGTYNTARRQCQWLRDVLSKATGGSVPLPVVKLDLSDEGCCSAYLGLMQQPSPEKICTFQACALAMGQLGCNQGLVRALIRHLDGWIRHLVTRKIKLGKETVRAPKGLVVPKVSAPAATPASASASASGAGVDEALFSFIRDSVDQRLAAAEAKMKAKERFFALSAERAALGGADRAVELLQDQRSKARENGDFATADALRSQLQSLGVEVVDTPLGPPPTTA